MTLLAAEDSEKVFLRLLFKYTLGSEEVAGRVGERCGWGDEWMAADADAGEACPACGKEVEGNAWKGVCEKGHVWGRLLLSPSFGFGLGLLLIVICLIERCGVTLKVLGTADVRSCLGCNRKVTAIARTQSDEMDVVDGNGADGFEDRLVRASYQCVYCGNRMKQSGACLKPGDEGED